MYLLTPVAFRLNRKKHIFYFSAWIKLAMGFRIFFLATEPKEENNKNVKDVDRLRTRENGEGREKNPIFQ